MNESTRNLVRRRAENRCEYCCRRQSQSLLAALHIEHILPRKHHGGDEPENLALACIDCNLAKGERTAGEDHAHQLQRLFNPRDYEPWLLGWHLHFVLDRKSGVIVPRTPRGEATVLTLCVNNPQRVFARRLQLRAGLIA